MTTAVVDAQSALRQVDPVLNEVAGLGLDDGVVHGGVSFRVRSVAARHLVGALSRLQRVPPRQIDTGTTISSGDFGPIGALAGRWRKRFPASSYASTPRASRLLPPRERRAPTSRSRPRVAVGTATEIKRDCAVAL